LVQLLLIQALERGNLEVNGLPDRLPDNGQDLSPCIGSENPFEIVEGVLTSVIASGEGASRYLEPAGCLFSKDSAVG